MGRSYNLKGSPINRGTAAKPSPTKALPLAALIGAGTMLVSKGISAYQQYKGGKKAKELALLSVDEDWEISKEWKQSAEVEYCEKYKIDKDGIKIICT